MIKGEGHYRYNIRNVENENISQLTINDPLILSNIRNRWYTVLSYTVFRRTGTVQHPNRYNHSSVMLQIMMMMMITTIIIIIIIIIIITIIIIIIITIIIIVIIIIIIIIIINE